jgi:hypothetical protein
LDLLRLASFFAIAVFHISLIHWGTPGIIGYGVQPSSWIITAVEAYARALSFSGFTIIFLTSLLIGLSRRSAWTHARLLSFIVLGWIAFSATMHNRYGWQLTWDIYPLLALGLCTAFVLRRWSGQLGAIGLILLCIPFWDMGTLGLNRAWQNVLGFANCAHGVSEWPILPWVGLIWVGYAAGQMVKKTQHDPQSLALSKSEALLWAGLMAAGIFTWGAFYNIRLGSYFACEAYRQPPQVFWGHFVWVLFIVRLAFDPRVNSYLDRQRWVHWIQGLAISQHFWIAYIGHYFLGHALSYIVDTVELEKYWFHDQVIELIALTYLPMTEFTCRGILRLLRLVDSVQGLRWVRAIHPRGEVELRKQPLSF